MYEIIKSVILSKDYKLEEMLDQIKKYCIYGDITTEQETELLALAREYALPENSYAEIQAQIDEIRGLIDGLNERVFKLENGGEVTPPGPAEEYPEYKQPTGAHDAYHNGDKITFKGEKYVCTAPDGIAVVWDPETYPDYWQKVTDTEEPGSGEGEETEPEEPTLEETK